MQPSVVDGLDICFEHILVAVGKRQRYIHRLQRPLPSYYSARNIYQSAIAADELLERCIFGCIDGEARTCQLCPQIESFAGGANKRHKVNSVRKGKFAETVHVVRSREKLHVGLGYNEKQHRHIVFCQPWAYIIAVTVEYLEAMACGRRCRFYIHKSPGAVGQLVECKSLPLAIFLIHI